MIFQIAWIGSKKMKRSRYKFQKISTSHYLQNGKKQLLHFFAHLSFGKHPFQNNPFPVSMLICYKTPTLYNKTSFFHKFDEKNKAFELATFTKRVDDSIKKEPLKMWTFSVKKSYHQPSPCGNMILSNQSQKTSIVLLSLTRRKIRNFDKNILD